MSKENKMLDKRGILTSESLDEFEKRGNGVSCECPDHLVQILRRIREFTEYQDECINLTPQDELTHNWLKTTSLNLEHIVSSTIVNLAKMEGILSHDNEFID